MNHIDLAAALAGGSTVVTPNKRLARRIAADHDAAQAARGLAVWPAVNVLPWSAWLDNYWLEALAAGALADSRPALPPSAAAYLWERIVGQDAALLGVRGAADLARDAWSRFHAWRRADEAFAAWAQSGFADDAAAFARWGGAYRKALDDANCIDAADLADVVAAAAASMPAWRDHSVVFAGFLDCSAQRRRMMDALAAAKVGTGEVQLPDRREARCLRMAAADRDAELTQALAFARSCIVADPNARVGIVVPDLAERRAEVVAVADDLLCPQLALAPGSERARPYGVTLGEPLTSVPLICVALDLIEWSAAMLDSAVAAAILRSPYLPGGPAAWMRRAGIEQLWRDGGIGSVGFAVGVAALASGFDPALAQRWRSVSPPPSRRQSPRAWVQVWEEWLVALGWPGVPALSSHEWQAAQRWARLLGEFSALDAVAPTLSRSEAMAALRAAAARTLFQPDAPVPPVQILGVLEAAGLGFDALWITGMAAERWPPPPAPSPLLPLSWQREHGVSRADAVHSLAFAAALTGTFAASAPLVIASHALTEDGQERAGSALFADWTLSETSEFPASAGYSGLLAAQAPRLEAIADALAPPLPDAVAVRGGVDVIERQSACPFQAFARHRLDAQDWPEPSPGLSARERGSLLHRAMAAFWQPDDAGPPAVDDPGLPARIASAADQACLSIPRVRWMAMSPLVAQGERRRLETTIAAWIETVERARPPFRVLATESDAALTLGGVTLRLQVDRIDALDEGVAIIDYKSGAAPGPNRWFASRPSGTQLGQYALALRDHDSPLDVRALAYARLKGGDIGVLGLAADAAAWPRLTTPQALRGVVIEDWAAAERHWRQSFGQLAADFREGHAEVAPRDAATCRYCAYAPLCRVRALGADDEAGEIDDGN